MNPTNQCNQSYTCDTLTKANNGVVVGGSTSILELDIMENNTTVENGTQINKFYFYESKVTNALNNPVAAMSMITQIPPVQFLVMWFLFVSIVIGNSTVLIALLTTKSRRSRMNYFIMHLAFADLCVGLLCVLSDIIQRITIIWLAGNVACKFIKFLQGVVTYSSTYVLVALSIDRCDAITHPMKFTGSWRRARNLIITAWMLSFLFCLPMLVYYEERNIQGTLQCWIDLGSEERWKIWMTSVFLSLFVLPALTITACYTIIVITIRTKSRKDPIDTALMSEEYELRRASSRGIIPKAKIKTIKMTFVIVFVFIVCWSPYMIFDLLQVYKCIPETQSNMAIASLIQSLAPLNSAANPVIYCIFSTKIFTSIRDLPPYKWICRMCGRSDLTKNNKTDADFKGHTELLTSSHRRTRRDNTLLQRTDGTAQSINSQRLKDITLRQVKIVIPEE